MKHLSQQIRKAIIARVAIALMGLVLIVGLVMYMSWLMKANHVSVDHTQRIAITPVQVDKIRSIGQWEFLSIADEELVDTVRHGFFGDSELARIYYGTLRLGVDLRQVKEGRITMDHDTVVVMLPAVSLLDVNFLDEARTRTFFESGKWTEADKAALTRQAREAMKRRCMTADNIHNAQENAVTQFGSLFKAMGFPYSKVRFQE